MYIILYYRLKFQKLPFVTGSVLTPSTITSPWTPVTGPPTDSNGPGPDTKNLDVGDISDVSFYINISLLLVVIEILVIKKVTVTKFLK